MLDSLKRWWGPWLGAMVLVTGLAGDCLIRASALPMQALAQQSLVLATAEDDWLHVRVSGDHYRLQPQGAISQTYIDLLLAYEDRRFWEHGGVDPVAIARAATNNLTHGGIVSGASTLSMQVSRLLRPHTRTLSGKVRQALGALWLERHYSKQAILNAYFTLAPFGANVEGIEMASRYWFNKSPRDLSHAESALLVALPQSPARHRPDRHPVRARAARDRVLRKGFESGLLSYQAYQDATLSPLPARPHRFAQGNHHLADRAHLEGLSGLVTTTIKSAPQDRIRQLARRWPLPEHENLSVLVVDRDGATVAHVGSAGYFDAPRNGGIDFSQRFRSPGSTLKPLIYAMAETAGVLRYEEIYLDAPHDFGGYSPVNFDRSDKGAQTFGDALAQSHNRAAVEALDRLSPATFIAGLRQAGVQVAGETNLSAAVGGIGVTLESLASLYIALLNGGQAKRVDWVARHRALPGYPILSETAAARTNFQLRQAALPNGTPRRGVLNAFALKTGTGPRGSDTLALAYNDSYVVAVWVGSPDNDPRPDSTGLHAAAPLALEALGLLPTSAPPYSVATGAPVPARRVGQPSMHLAFPSDGTELAFPPGERAIKPVIVGAQYPITVVLNDCHVQRLDRPGDVVEFPSAGFWELAYTDAGARELVGRVRVW